MHRWLLALAATLLYLPPAPAGAQATTARIWGRVETRGGAIHEGFIRWGRDGGSWADVLDADEPILVDGFERWNDGAGSAEAVPDRVVEVGGERIVVPDPLEGVTRAGIRFGHLRRLESRGSGGLRLELRSGEVVELGGDIPSVLVDTPGEDRVALRPGDVVAVDFAAPPPGARPRGERLHGTVVDRTGNAYTGFLAWGPGGILTTDTLRVASEDRGSVVPLGRVTAIRRVEERAVASLVDGRSLELSRPAKEGGEGPGVVVSDPVLGQVEVGWDVLDSVRFHPPEQESGYRRFDGGAPLRGTVITRSGSRLAGPIRFNAGTPSSWELLEGRRDTVAFRVELGAVARVEPLRETSTAITLPGGFSVHPAWRSARVTLRDGRVLELRGSDDVSGDNRGILVRGGDGPWVLVAWRDIEALSFDEVGAGITADRPANPVDRPSGRAASAVRTPRPLASDAFLDGTAEGLFRSAQASWQAIDSSVVRYTAVIRQRLAARIRTPLKDRTIYRNENAVRAFWDRDHEPLVQILGSRAEYPGREERHDSLGWLDDLALSSPFEPGGDRLLLGPSDRGRASIAEATEREVGFAHPLAAGADTLYRYRSGDTLTLTLPDGRRLLTVQLDVLPREADSRRISGTLWIEPESGALVRAVFRQSRELDLARDVPEVRDQDEAGEFRLVPGLLKPWTLTTSLVTVDYSLWDFRVWLPRSMRVEGEVGVGVIKVPLAFDLSYDIESVTTVDDLDRPGAPDAGEGRFATRGEAMEALAGLLGRADGVDYRSVAALGDTVQGRSRLLAPVDPEVVATSPRIPPPLGEDAPGFATREDLARSVGALAELPRAYVPGAWTVRWGWGGRDLLRYNRVEGVAVGARLQAPLASAAGPLDLRATVFLGLADREPKGRVELERATLRRRTALGMYRELRSTEPGGRPLELGNSLDAFLFGRDDGDYYLATGADLVWRPPEASRASWRARVYAERQDPVSNHADFALFRAFDGDGTFRAALESDRLDEVGGEVALSPWWGTDPGAAQVGLELVAQGGAWRRPDSTATSDYLRTAALLRLAVPVAGPDWRVGLEAGGGTAWGTPPLQRAWFLGGPRSLRGYDPATLRGPTFVRGRLEVARGFGQAAYLGIFGDMGWAGAREALDRARPLWGVGIGGSLLDGLLRVDLSHGLREPGRRLRLDVYLDAIF